MENTKQVKCKVCGKRFAKAVSQVSHYPNHYCSRVCFYNKGRVTCRCAHCGIEFTRHRSNAAKYTTHFCNEVCVQAYNAERRETRECKTCGQIFAVKPHETQTHLYCSHSCRATDSKKRVHIPCQWCGKIVERTPAHIKKTTFCSCSCRANYHIRQRQGFRRSHGEKFLAALIAQDFPIYTLLENKKNLLPSGLEIDIFVKEVNLAIELNGPCHYFNIYGEEALRGVQARDSIKHSEIQKAGYQFIVLDISTISDRKKLERFLQSQYNDNIKPLLNYGRVGSIGP